MTNPKPVEEMLAQSGLPDDSDVAAFLTDLRALGEGPAPAPSPPLAALLGATPLQRSVRRRQRLAAAITAVALAGATATGAAAAANELPAPAQRVVSQWSHDHLPFHFPAPHAEHEGEHRGGEPGEHRGDGTGGHSGPSGEHGGDHTGTGEHGAPGDGEHGTGETPESPDQHDGGTSDDGGLNGSHAE